MVGPIENDLRFTGFGVLENLDRLDARFLRATGKVLEEDEVPSLALDGERIRQKRSLGGTRRRNRPGRKSVSPPSAK